MGSVLHGFAEKLANGRWERLTELEVSRNHHLFGLMVDGHVRAYGEKGLFKEKGWPEDIKKRHEEEFERAASGGGYGGDYKIPYGGWHTISWLDGSE